MSGYGDFDLNVGYSLDEMHEIFGDMVDNFKTEKEEALACELSPVSASLDGEENHLIWEDVTLSDGLVMSQNSIQLSQGSVQSQNVAVPTKVKIEQPEFAPMPAITNIPDIDILHAAYAEIPDSPSPSEATTSEDGEARYSNPMLTHYGIDDDTLSDMSLKKLRALCRGDEDHFNQLKAYRRTCLNRHYARSSRAKNIRQSKTMSTELEKSKKTITRLTKENQEKDAMIKYLELELQIMRGMKN